MPSLLQRVASGDPTAVEACLDEYGGLVWRLAMRYLDQSRGDAEDAVQEVFIELWLNAAKFDPTRGSEASFVATLAHRRLIDAQRRATTRHNRVAAARDEIIRSSSTPPKLAPSAPDEVSAVSRAFDQLPGDEHETLWLAVHGGLTHRQISEATQSPIGTVKTRLRRAVARLYGLLTPEEPHVAAGGKRA